MESALLLMEQANINLEVFQETKVTDGVYTQELAGYRILVAEAPSQHQGGVEVFH